MMFEDQKRGGVSTTGNIRCAKANNKFISEEYDSSKPYSQILYLDANNLYGWAMQQKLPISDIKFMQDISLIDTEFILNF